MHKGIVKGKKRAFAVLILIFPLYKGQDTWYTILTMCP